MFDESKLVTPRAEKGPQQEEFSSKISLAFFRHGEKETDEAIPNAERQLTPDGRQQARFSDGAKNLHQSMAFGSDKPRAQQTAGLKMSPENFITGDESLDTLRESLDEERVYGSKIAVDNRLNFNEESSSATGSRVARAFKEGDYLKVLVEESDRIAVENGDTEAATYSRHAANVAEIIKKYTEIAPRFDQLAHDEAKDYGNVMERFMGSHQGVPDSFLTKVIDKTRGRSARDRFIRLLNDAGFDFVEGFTVDIVTPENDTNVLVRVQFEREGDARSEYPEQREDYRFDEVIPISLIDEIIQERV